MFLCFDRVVDGQSLNVSKSIERLADSPPRLKDRSLEEIFLLVFVPSSGIFPEGNYFPCSEDPCPPARSHHLGNRASDFHYFMAIPETDGRERLHGYERRILTGREEKDCGS